MILCTRLITVYVLNWKQQLWTNKSGEVGSAILMFPFWCTSVKLGLDSIPCVLRSRGGRWSWTLKLAQKRPWTGRWSWAAKVGLFFASGCSLTAVQRTLSLWLPSTAVETVTAQCTSRCAMARGHRLNTSIVLAAVHYLSGLFRAVSAVELSLSRPLTPLSPSLISSLASVDVKQYGHPLGLCLGVDGCRCVHWLWKTKLSSADDKIKCGGLHFQENWKETWILTPS